MSTTGGIDDIADATAKIEVSGSAEDQLVIKHLDSKNRLILYKFMEEKFATDLCERGKLRIGTLHYYRDKEAHCDSDDILDTEEGTATFVDREPSPGELLNSVFTGPADEPDRYIFCASTSNAWAASPSKSYDVCVEIFEPGNFMAELRSILRHGVSPSTASQYGFVFYREREFTRVFGGGMPFTSAPTKIAYIKPEKYSPQHEYRFGFPGAPPPKEFFYVESPALKRYCRIVKWRKNEDPIVLVAIGSAGGKKQFDLDLVERAKREGFYTSCRPDYEHSKFITEAHLKDPGRGRIDPAAIA